MELEYGVYGLIKAEVDKRLNLGVDSYRLPLYQNRVASYMHASACGTKFFLSGNSACHAGMAQSKGWDLVVDLLQPKAHKTVDDTPEEKFLFLDYVMNRSPLAFTFVTKDTSKAFEDGFTIRDLEQPANVVQMGLILTRALHHDYQDNMVKAFYALVKAGLQEDVAMVFATYTYVGINKTTVRYSPSGHFWWDSKTARTGDIVKYLHRNIYHATKSFKSGASYDGVFSTFSSCNGGKILQWLIEKLKEELIVESESVNNNPFPTDNNAGSNNEYINNTNRVISALVSIGNEFYEENKK